MAVVLRAMAVRDGAARRRFRDADASNAGDVAGNLHVRVVGRLTESGQCAAAPPDHMPSFRIALRDAGARPNSMSLTTVPWGTVTSCRPFDGLLIRYPRPGRTATR